MEHKEQIVYVPVSGYEFIATETGYWKLYFNSNHSWHYPYLVEKLKFNP